MTTVEMCCYVLMFVLLATLMSECVGTKDALKTRSKRTFHVTKFDIPRGGRNCHDYCAMMSHMCRNGGTCFTDQLTCEGKCECSPGWTGKWCKDRAPTTERKETTARTSPVSTVVNNLSMFTDDVLETNGISTETDHVEIEDSMSVTEMLPLLSDNRTQTGLQDSIQGQTSTDITSVTSEGRNMCQPNCSDGDCFRIFGEYKCKSRINSSDSGATKVCGPGWVCENGICDLEDRKNNQYRCKCERNYVGHFCDLPCPLSCGEHGFCDVVGGKNRSLMCFCEWNYTGLNCSELVPEETDISQDFSFAVPHWYVVGIPVAIVVLVLSAMFTAAYFMWRRRLVFMLKIVHYFQHYEDDDGKEFDAFISYKSSPEDEAFVLQQLYPRLESQLNFKLCLHFRDFVPGEAIANNIVRAVESSRRTIMVLSPSYVKSEWCRMEYQKAQHEMLKLKHKIIPIVLEDVSELTNLDKNLKSILSSVTYIEWPGPNNSKRLDKFWKKLELSMPKRSCNTSGYSENESDQYFSNSSSSSSDKISNNPKNESISISSRFRRSKRKNLKHFMGKFVQSNLFNRQDSNSSQAALVDEETVASRSSYDSMSESVFTESSESACSTPVTAHTYLGNVDENQEANNIFFSDSSRRVSRSKEHLTQLCEKDHCEGSECTTCIKIRNYPFIHRESSDKFVNRGFSPDEDVLNTTSCRYCQRSDNNRVRISAVEGDKLKIERLAAVSDICTCCHHPLNRQSAYRGSMKEHKEAANRELLKQTRVGSLPRNYKRSTELVRREVALDINTLRQELSDSKGHFYIDVCEDV